MFIAIDGPIGVGKTTLAGKLAKSLDALFVKETFDEELLKEFYGGDPGTTVSIQYHFLYSRYRQHREIAVRLEKGESVVCDYHFAKNLIFAVVNLRPRDLEIFRRYATLFSREIPSPDVVVYLQGSLSAIQGRIRRRGRGYEKKIRSGYLETIVSGYGDHFLHTPPDRLLVVNTDDINVADVKADFEDLRNVILEAPHGVHYYHPPGSK